MRVVVRLAVERTRQESVAREVVEAWTRARSLSEQIAAAEQGLSAAQDVLRPSQERREFGIADVLERILAEQDLTRARNEYLAAVAEYDKAQYALLRARRRDEVGAGVAPLRAFASSRPAIPTYSLVAISASCCRRR
jgi:outer membrane protein TolC